MHWLFTPPLDTTWSGDEASPWLRLSLVQPEEANKSALFPCPGSLRCLPAGQLPSSRIHKLLTVLVGWTASLTASCPPFYRCAVYSGKAIISSLSLTETSWCCSSSRRLWLRALMPSSDGGLVSLLICVLSWRASWSGVMCLACRKRVKNAPSSTGSSCSLSDCWPAVLADIVIHFRLHYSVHVRTSLLIKVRNECEFINASEFPLSLCRFWRASVSIDSSLSSDARTPERRRRESHEGMTARLLIDFSPVTSHHATDSHMHTA